MLTKKRSKKCALFLKIFKIKIYREDGRVKKKVGLVSKFSSQQVRIEKDRVSGNKALIDSEFYQIFSDYRFLYCSRRILGL